MEEYIIILSKYFISICIALYTYECFSVFRFKEEEHRKGIYTRQIILMFFVHFTCFLTIFLKTADVQYLFFYAFQQLSIFTILVLFEMFYPTGNRLILNNMCFLLVVGFVILTRLDMTKALKQFIIATISVIIAMIIPHFIRRMKFLKNLTWVYGFTGLAALSLVLILGSITNGSKISYSILGITFQPSEFVKIIFVFFVASAFAEITDFKQVVIVSIFAALHVLVLVVSKDLGSALIFFVAYIFMLFLATKNVGYLILGGLAGAAGSVAAFNLFTHLQVRVQAWKDPWSVIDGEGYQVSQSLFAIGRGGLFGLGLFNGAPDDIPYVEQDFIFSAVTEEMGLIFSCCLILICLSCFIMFMNISIRLKDCFYQLIAYGLGIIYIFQIFLTIGGNTKFIPLTGVTLPLISYGGSSVLTTLIMFSIIEGLFMIRQDEGNRSVKKGKKRKRESYRESGQDEEYDEENETQI